MHIERDAMGDDEYHPISQHGSNLTKAGGIGYTVIDSIDTMQLMGLTDEYQRARSWVENELSFDRDANFNTFEVSCLIFSPTSVNHLVSIPQTTIRVLGGLLSAYHLSSEDPLFLQRAIELADRMMPVFDTPSGLPKSMINLKRRQGASDTSMAAFVSTAEATTLQLEFRYLSFLTDHEDYWDKVEGVSNY